MGLHLSSQELSVIKAVVAAAKKGIVHRPTFDEIKARFNFGKNLFYKGPSEYTSWTIGQMQARAGF
jgi:hypothetical protein